MVALTLLEVERSSSVRLCFCPFLQKGQFGMYALYSKNKPKSDSLLASHGNAFFRVSGANSSLGERRLPCPRQLPSLSSGGPFLLRPLSLAGSSSRCSWETR